MEDVDYTLPGDSKDLWEQTSRWRYVQLETLQLELQDCSEQDISGNIDITKIELSHDSNRLLLPCEDVRDYHLVNNLPAHQRIFFNRLLQLTIFDDEPPVDAVTSDLLTYSGFECDVIHFRPRPRLRFSCLSYEITSIPDYGVFIDTASGHLADEYLVVVEDKAPGKQNKQYTECQLCGEMLACALVRYSSKEGEKPVFGIIVSGLDVRFYKTIFSRNYLSSVLKGKRPREPAIVKKYPSADNYALSLNKLEQREIIVRMLHAIRIQLENIAEKTQSVRKRSSKEVE